MSATTATIFGATATVTKVALQSHLSIAGEEEDGTNSATDYYVITWDHDSMPILCRGCSDGTNVLPVRGDTNPYDGSLSVKRVQIDPIDNITRKQFSARVEYTDALEGISNPLTDPPEIEWDISDGNEVPYFLDNNPSGPQKVVLSSGELFSDYLTRLEGSVSATFKKNVNPTTGYNVSQVIQYTTPTPAVNTATFTFDGQTIAAGQARFRGASCSAVQQANGVKYRTMTIHLDFKSAWTQIVDNRGFNEVTSILGDQKLREITKGIPPTKPERPWPLDTFGAAKPNITDDPSTSTFYPYPQLPFSVWSFV